MSKIRDYVQRTGIVATLAGAALVGLTGCASTNTQSPLPSLKNEIHNYVFEMHSRPAKERPVHTLDHLVVNSSDDFVTEVIESEEAGVRDMRNLVATESAEEAWVYSNGKFTEVGAPGGFGMKVQKNEDGTLLIGYFASTSGADRGKFANSSETIVQYHIHPSKFPASGPLIKKLKEDQPELNSEDLRKVKSYLEGGLTEHSLLMGSVPSDGDLVDMIKGALSAKRTGTNILFKVCSKYGVAEYGLTPKGIEYFKDKSDQEIEDYASRIADFRRVNPSSTQDMVRLVANEYISVNFTPHQN